MNEQAVVEQIVKKIKNMTNISLDTAKTLLDKIEAYSKEKGLNCVFAVYDSHGNPVAIHVMEDAFLVSYQVATQKAYTAVALKMPTMEVGKLVQAGGPFFGLEKLDQGKIVAFGGGVPLKVGDRVVGGLGVSGGTDEEDHDIASYGLKVFDELMK